MVERALWAVVPVKPFHAAKRRLAPVLDAAERAQLAHLMLQDVLDALVACEGLLAGVIVVTRDPQAADAARARGALVLSDGGSDGINAAVAVATAHLAEIPHAGAIVVPSDIPHLGRCAIEQITVGMSAPRAVAVIPAIADGGTNLLACAPAGVIAPRFGTNSCYRHCQAARRAGIEPSIMVRADVGRDIDRPEDLAAFLAMGSTTRTHAFLSELGVAERLRRWSGGGCNHPRELSSAALEA